MLFLTRLSAALAAAASIGHAQTTTSPNGVLHFTPVNANVTRVTVTNPPINLFDNNLLHDMLGYLRSIVPPADSATTYNATLPKVVIFSSANPDFFLMHRDVQGISPPELPWKPVAISDYIAITRFLQNITTTVFIAECNGRAYGAGNEVMLQMDMRFAGPNASVGFFENGVGVFPGGGGTQFLHDTVGKARTLEHVLGTLTIDGPYGAQIGWFNRYYDDAATLTSEIELLAKRIAIYPAGVINATKAGLAWRNAPIEPVLEGDIAEFVKLDQMPDRDPVLKEFLKVTGNETATPFEMDTPQNMPLLYAGGHDLAVAGG